MVARQVPWQPAKDLSPAVMWDCVKFDEIRFIKMAVSGKVPVARVVARQLPWQPAKDLSPVVMCDCVKLDEIRFINMAVS